jgi:hypothetical protein
MKYLLFASSIALGLALQPVNAQEQDAAKPQATHEQETLHAPTNRIGEMVPTMTAEPSSNAAQPKDATGEHKAETVHPPTNRVGEAVPTMKSAENKDDQKSSRTDYYGDDKKKSSD